MSILIKGMEMPKDGDVLMVRKDDDGKTYIKGSHTWGYSAEIIELPAGHGRLIDADALVKKQPIPELGAPRWLIEQAPTIIEA